MKLNRIIIRNSCLTAWKLFGVASLLITTVFVFFPDFIDVIKMYSLSFRIIAIFGLLLICLFLGFLIYIQKKKIVIRFAETEVEISAGKLFNNRRCCYDGYNVISVSELFCSTMGPHISDNTTHFEFLRQIVGTRVNDIDQKIKESLSQTNPKNPNEEPKRYPFGTTAIVNFGREKYIFLVIVEKDKNYRCIPTSIQDFLKVLAELWKVLRVENDGCTVNMTLLGSGRSNVKMSPHHILQTILMSLYYESQNNIVIKKLRIIVDEEKIKLIDLRNIKFYWDAASLMNHSDI
jgi:hypothetical protein